jgi:hypothetical protein
MLYRFGFSSGTVASVSLLGLGIVQAHWFMWPVVCVGLGVLGHT